LKSNDRANGHPVFRDFRFGPTQTLTDVAKLFAAMQSRNNRLSNG